MCSSKSCTEQLLLENIFKRFQKIVYVVLNNDEIDAVPYLVLFKVIALHVPSHCSQHPVCKFDCCLQKLCISFLQNICARSKCILDKPYSKVIPYFTLHVILLQFYKHLVVLHSTKFIYTLMLILDKCPLESKKNVWNYH